MQSSTDFENWTVLTNFTFASSLYEYFDPDAATSAHRFYRVAPPPPLKVGRATRPGPGQVQIEVDGEEGLRALIQASENLESWASLSTNLISNGRILFADPDADRVPHRFYRARPIP